MEKSSAYSLSSSSTEPIEDLISLTEKARIATIAENKINNAFSLKREPSLRYILFQAGLIVRAAHKINVHSTAVKDQPNVEDEDDWGIDSDEDLEDEERDWEPLEMKKKPSNETGCAKTSSNCNPFDDPPLHDDEDTTVPLTRSPTQFRPVHPYSTPCRMLATCGDSKEHLSHQLAIVV